MNTVTIFIVNTMPAQPHSCDSLGALCGHPPAEMRLRGGAVELDFPDDWTPTAEELAALRAALESGQG